MNDDLYFILDTIRMCKKECITIDIDEVIQNYRGDKEVLQLAIRREYNQVHWYNFSVNDNILDIVYIK